LSINDRRRARRFQTPDGEVRLYSETGNTTGHNLIDFSYNSARFMAKRTYQPEQELVFDLAASGHDINSLKGYVVRVQNAEEFQNNYFVVIKFLPFSTLDKYNTLENYQILKNLISELEKKGPDPRVR
jgi:hypothetical protein